MKSLVLSILSVGSLAASLQAQSCIQLGGTWCGTERATITIRADGETDTQEESGYGCFTITQAGCTITFYSKALVGGGSIELKRSGPVTGNRFTVTGALAPSTVSGYQVSFKENWLRGEGTVVGNTMTLTTVGRAVGSVEGMDFTVDVSSSATFTDNRTPTPPTITLQPVSKTGALDGSVSLRVEATGIGPLRYKWWHDGVRVPDGTNATLTLNNLQFSDAGPYWATVGNFDGQVTSRTAELTVVDRTPPILSFKFPSPGARITNQPVLEVRGKATDNVGVVAIWLDAGGTGFSEVPDYTGTTNWLATIRSEPGTNTLRAFAVDAAGNSSMTNTLRFFQVVAAPITLRVDPSNGGSISGLTDQQLLEIGQGYTVNAVRDTNFLFAGWTGSRTSSSPSLSFVMEEGMVLQANFVTNRFLAVRGIYHGLFGPTNDTGVLATDQVHPTNSGLVTLTVTKLGAVTGKIYLAGTNHDFAGPSDPSGHAAVEVTRTGQPRLNLHLWFDLPESPEVAPSQRVRGTVSDGSWSATFAGHRTGLFSGTSNYFTFIIPSPGTVPDPNRPGGDGAGFVTATTNGVLTLAGTLGDGTPVTQGAALAREGDWPVFVPLYGGAGLLLGWGSVSAHHAPLDLKADLVWFKPPGLSGKRYPGGFAERVELRGARYAKPPRDTTPLNWTNGIVRLDAGTLDTTLIYDVLWVSNKLVVMTSTNNLWLTNALKSGLFGGMFRHPLTGKSMPFAGAYVRLPQPDLGWGGGWFKGTNQTGYIEIVPTPPGP